MTNELASIVAAAIADVATSPHTPPAQQFEAACILHEHWPENASLVRCLMRDAVQRAMRDLIDGATPATRLAAAVVILDPRVADAIAFHEQEEPGARWWEAPEEEPDAHTVPPARGPDPDESSERAFAAPRYTSSSRGSRRDAPVAATVAENGDNPSCAYPALGRTLPCRW